MGRFGLGMRAASRAMKAIGSNTRARTPPRRNEAGSDPHLSLV
ncbi:MAG: hypothetical protein ACI9MR_001601 [Myxococcota bacterium]|jgi:hypothetical protein